MKVFVYSQLDHTLHQRIKKELPRHEVTSRDPSSNEVPVEFVQAELLLGNPPRVWLEQATSLRFWQLDSAGFDQYKGLAVNCVAANVGDYYAVKCAETMLAGILAFYRNIPRIVMLQSRGEWVGKPLRAKMDTLSNKRVAILGAGAIARALRKMLQGLSCDVLLVARKDPAATIHTRERLLQTLPHMHVVVNTLPGTADRFVDEEFLASMAPGSLYATVGRGNTTDEEALIRSLQSQKLAGAVLDVTQKEPLPATSPLWSMPNVILTQHSAGGHFTEDEAKADIFITNVKRYLANEPVLNMVDVSKGY